MAKKLSDFDKAVREAQRRLPILRDKALNANLNWACCDMADAYRVGADEAQCEIVNRLRVLAIESSGTPNE